jgi:RNA polymerase sigma-70 factor (ECF subfamily)
MFLASALRGMVPLGKYIVAMPSHTAANFPDHTRYSLVLRASDQKDRTLAARALNELCSLYWEPVYAFARRRGLGEEDAQDCVQGVFASMVSDPNDDDAKGPLPAVCITRELKLRAFLMQQVNDQISRTHQRAMRQKRGAGAEHVSFDFSGAEDRYQHEDAQFSPDAVFNRQWARMTLNRCLETLQKEETRGPRASQLKVLLPFISSTSPGDADYLLASAALNQSEATTRQQVKRLKDRYKLILKREVARTLAMETGADPSDQAVVDELKCLSAAL